MSTAPEWFFPPDSLIWRTTRERAVLVAGPAAAILQVAHPRIALGVAEHSDFTRDTIGRLNRTLHIVNSIVFGTPADAAALRKRMMSLHAKVRGDAAGAQVPGAPSYHGLEPDLLLWVLATLCAAGLEGYRWACTGVEATLAQKAEYYAQIRRFGEVFGLPAAYGPADWAAFELYYSTMLAGSELGSHPLCREQAHFVAFPARPRWAHWLGRAGAGLSTAFIPEPVRTRLGLGGAAWSPAVVETLGRGVRALVPRLPAELRFTPEYRAVCSRLGDHGV